MRKFEIGDIIIGKSDNNIYKIKGIRTSNYRCLELHTYAIIDVAFGCASEPSLAQYLKALKLQEEHSG